MTVVVAAVASCVNAHALELDKPAQSCQAAIGKAGRSLKGTYLKAFGAYLHAETVAPGSGDVTKRDEAISKAFGKFDAAIAKKCDAATVGSDVLTTAAPAGLGFPSGTCGQLWGGSPAGAYETACAALPAGTAAEDSACWRCFLVGELREWLKIHYPWVQGLVPDGSDLDCGMAPVVTLPPSSADSKCLTAIPKLANAVLLGTDKVTEACLDNVRKGKIAGGPGACPDAKAQTAIAKLQGKVTAGVAKACATLPAWWNECPESAVACASNPIGSLAALSACSNGSAQPIGNEITCGLYAGAAADGVACAPTPTLTPTPTPTSTPSGLSDGAACSSNVECLSTNCVDGVCCNSACNGACQACSAVKKGSGTNGICGPVSNGADPDNECAASSPATCGFDGFCNGGGSCRLYVFGTVCGPGQSCNGGGVCQ